MDWVIFARKYGGSPSSLHTQLRYLTNEVQWQEIEGKMKTPGKSINSYMTMRTDGSVGAFMVPAHSMLTSMLTD